MASLPSSKRTKEKLKTLTVDDVKDIEVNKALGLSDNIGF